MRVRICMYMYVYVGVTSAVKEKRRRPVWEHGSPQEKTRTISTPLIVSTVFVPGGVHPLGPILGLKELPEKSR